MNPRVSRSSRAGVQGHRLPDREDRREAGHRLHPRRDPQRHHRRHPGRVRADAGLRGGEDPAVRVREVPRRRPRADHDDEERRRGDVAGPQLRRGAGQGDAVDGDQGRGLLDRSGPTTGRPRSSSTRCACPHDGRLYTVERALRRRRHASSRSPRPPAASTRGSSTRSRLVELRRRDPRRAVARRRSCCAGRSGPGCPTAQLAALRPELAGEDGVRTLRHRLGIRPVYKTVDTCAAEFAATTPYHYSSYDEETEVAAARAAEGADPRLRAEPDRAGHRVRLLLRARGHGAAGRRLRDGDGQLQPGDRLHRLRHRRPALLRAADLRGRARGGRTPRRRRPAAGGRASSCSSAGRPRWAWRSGSRTPGCRSSAPRPRRSTWPRTAGAFGRVLADAGLRAPAHGTATTFAEAQRDRRRDRLPGAGPAVLRARRPRHGDRLRRRHARAYIARATDI